MKKILVTGANGMLGQDLCPILEDEGYEVIETDIQNLDITKADMADKIIKAEKPDIVIHCAAYTDVDKAEKNLETARLINAKGTDNIAKACSKIGAAMVYISTDYIFSGDSTQPYKPDDKPSPLNNYGLTKLEGEEAVKNNLEKYYICRTSWLYGHHGKNFVETVLSLANKSELKIVDDQIGCPTWTVDLSNAIVKIIGTKPYGTYHVCGGGSTSWYGFAKEIFKQYKATFSTPDEKGFGDKLKPCKTSEFPAPAKRPAYSVMDNDGELRDWKSALKDYMKLRIGA